MSGTVLVKPWPGLILADVPPKGAELPAALAEEWIANHLVVRVVQPAPSSLKPSIRPTNPRGSRPRKQRRTR